MTTPTSPTNVCNKIRLEDDSGYLLAEDGSYLLYEWYALAPSQHTLSEPSASKQATMADPGRQATIADDGRQYTPPERG